MSKTAFVSAVALVAMLAAPTFAQDMQHIIGGNAVPAHQIEAVQAKCDELRAAGSADAAATTDTTTGADTTAGTTTTEIDAAASTEAAMEVEVDLDTLTIEMCDEGGFTASAM